MPDIQAMPPGLPLQPLLPPDDESGKHPLQSKTLIFNAAFGLLPFLCPKLYQFVLTLTAEQQLQVMSGAFAVINILLRSFTSSRINWSRAIPGKNQ